MTYSITVRQSNAAKKSPTYAALQKHFAGLVHIGGIGRYFEFEPEPAAPGGNLQAAYMLFGASGLIGRGFYLYVEKGGVYEVTTPLPTTVHDLEDMFTFTGMLAKLLGAKTVEDKQGAYPRAMLPNLYPDLLKNNLEMLRSYAINRPGFTVSGVRLPVVVPNSVCGRIGAVPPANGERFFTSYLNEKQLVHYDYLKPEFSRDAITNQPRGRYQLWEGRSYIAPKRPFIPYGPNPFDTEPIENWQVALVSAQLGTLGALPYSVFLQRLSPYEQREFDEKYFILNALDLRRLQEILEGN